jgi:hypothetical protein
MYRTKLSAFAFSLFILISCKKNPTAEPPIPNNQALTWIKNFGGTNWDMFNAVVEIPGGGYVVAGTSRSTDGDLTGARVSYDPWITRVDNNGVKVWTAAFGDNSDEYVTAMTATADGGFIAVYYSGYPLLPVGGTPNYAWAIKVNSSGVKQWEKKITSSTDAQPFSITATTDGNFVVAGFANDGTRQGWITKIDGNGTTIWEKFYGGASEDIFNSVAKTNDGGYIVAGYSKSTGGDPETNKGLYDGWLMKLDASGNKTWSKTYGGSQDDNLTSVITTNDGFLALGSSKSSNGDLGGNKGGYDAWVVKVDGSGTKQWVKNYGGNSDEMMTSLVTVAAGGYVMGGYTNSVNGDVTRNAGDYGGWLLKIDAAGNKNATSTYGGTGDEVLYALTTTSDGGFLIAGTTYSLANNYDGWLVKVGPF